MSPRAVRSAGIEGRARRGFPPALVVVAALVAFLTTTIPSSGAVPPPPLTPGGLPASFPPPVSTPAPAPGSPTSDWPTYMGSPEHTGANLLERTIAPSNVSRLQEVWNRSTNGSDLSAPIVVNDTVYFGSWNGYEYAVNGSDGAIDWATRLGYDSMCYATGIESTPAYDHGTLYLGAPNGSWDALNATTGALRWSYFVGAPSSGYYDWASALVVAGSLYIGTSSCDDNPMVPGQLLELNLSGAPTLRHVWNATPGGEPGTTVWTTPTLDASTHTIWVATGNDNGTAQPYAQSMVALNATTLAVQGSWQVPNVVGTDSDFGATPTLVSPSSGPGLVVATNKNGRTYAFDRSNATSAGWGPTWSIHSGGSFSGAAFDGARVYVGGARGGSPGTVVALEPSNGSIDWARPLPAGWPRASLTYADGLVFVGANGTEYALDAQNGSVLWQFAAPPGELIAGEAVVADGRLYVPTGTAGGNAGHLFAFGIPLAGTGRVSVPDSAAPWTARFQANATGGLLPYNFSWTFDDGASITGAVVAHTFAHPGPHVGTVSITDQGGSRIVRNLSVVTSGTPVFRASIQTAVSRGETPFQVTLNATLTNGSGPPYAYRWNYGDGSGGDGYSVVHTFGSPGTFTVALNATGPQGETANASARFVVVSGLAVSATPAAPVGSAPLAVEFAADVQYGAPPYIVTWEFGDASPNRTGPSVNHTYLAVGHYNATATARDSFGYERSSTVAVRVVAVPLTAHPSAGRVSENCPDGSQVVDLAANPSGGVAPYRAVWRFGDGSVGTGLTLRHTFAAIPNAANGTVEVTDNAGAKATAPLLPLLDDGPPAPCPSGGVHPSAGGGISATWLIVPIGLGAAVVAAALIGRGRARRLRRPATPPPRP